MYSGSRRDFLLTAAALWQAARLDAEHQHSPSTLQPAGSYNYLFLSSPEQDTLRVLMARIVPADDRSAGAAGAHVDQYVDFILAHAQPALQQTWRSGLARYGGVIAGKRPSEIDAWLEQQCRNEFAPTNDDEAFFVLLKQAVAEGFYTSEQGIVNELGYKGMTFLLDFEGCTHATHHAPEGWRPQLQQRRES